MEYMRIEGFLGGAVSKLINKGIESKFGYKPDIEIDNLNLRTIGKLEVDVSTNEVIRRNGEDRILLDLSVSMSQDDFNKLMEEVTK